MGFLLINSPFLASSALLVFLAGWFGLAALRSFVAAWRKSDPHRTATGALLRGLGDLAAAAALLLVRGSLLEWLLAVAAAMQIFQTAWEIARSEVLAAGQSGNAVLTALGLTGHPELERIADDISRQEMSRSAIDRGWIIGFIATLFAIHVGRMGFDRSFLGIVSPVVAVAGDVLAAILLAFAVVIPVTSTWRRLTRPLERRAWQWCLAVRPTSRRWLQALVQRGLTYRLRRSIRLQQARLSSRTALSRGLQIGLPLTAVIVATVPVWGMSWYFDTENWAAGIWNSWAAERTDTWREAMARPVWKAEESRGGGLAFSVDPGPFDRTGDFSFIVIGDPGEGDASQLSLKSQLLEVAGRDDVKFVVISSDVVYPTGAMRHYEMNFWMPFMGVTKPVFAIPGNHDWYDALDAFTATFFEPDAARLALRARVDADAHVSSTTDSRIDELIAIATRLQGQYLVPVQKQKAPYFQFQTPTFAFIAVDTGVERTLDPLQREWLEDALAAAKGKTVMVLLGHPFYAGGGLTMEADSEFAELRQLLAQHDVSIVMAGDTHDLEYYEEPRPAGGEPVRHFVNGGGGAYLSFGTALAWPRQPATATWAYYPSRREVTAKIADTTPSWKRPFWWWTKYLGAWPFSAEWLSAAFDVNTAPFMQSFVEVRVEPSAKRIRIIPYGVHGRLNWSDFDRSGMTGEGSEFVEWAIPMRQSAEMN